MSILQKLARKVRSNGVGAVAEGIRYRVTQRWEYGVLLPYERWHHTQQNGVSVDIRRVNHDTLSYFAGNRFGVPCEGAYSYLSGGPPLLYASVYAALTFHLCGELETLSEAERRGWASVIGSYQSEDGLFRDPRIDIPLASACDWWGWRHLSLHALMALTALGAVATAPFEIVRRFRKRGAMCEWLESRNWADDATSVSNEVQNLGTFLQYARDFQGCTWCSDALNEMFDWLDGTQDSTTGCWGHGCRTPVERSQAVQTGYHLWMLYFYDRRPVQYVDRIIDSCLATQNRLGGFGSRLNSSACEDIDSIDPLVRLTVQTEYRRRDVERALARAFGWVLFHQNADGGWVFRRREAFQYGHPLMRAAKHQSAAFPSWFRTLSLAYLAQVLKIPSLCTFPWRFLSCPGHQFWNPASTS